MGARTSTARGVTASVLATLLLAATAVACAAPAPTSPVGAATGRPGAAGVLSPRPCEPGLGVQAECYWFDVPERWEFPHPSRRIRIPVQVLHSPSANPRPDPLYVPAGGPGYPGLTSGDISGSVLIADRDLVLIDQRGTGISEPSLNCPEKEASVLANFGVADSYDVELAGARAAVRSCYHRLRLAGIDLGAYNTPNNARDAIELRRALGYDQWNVLGGSYGSRVALELVRQDPDGTRAVVLDSVYPPGVGGIQDLTRGAARAFYTLLVNCLSHPGCSRDHPALVQNFLTTVTRYDADPIETSVTLGDGSTIPLVLTGGDLISGLFNALYDTTLIPLLPGIIDQLAAGNTGIVPVIAQRGIPFINDISEGMNLSTDCTDNFGLTTWEGRLQQRDPGMFGALLLYLSASFCQNWAVRPTGPAFQQPVVSDVPALVLGGSNDPITPPENGRAASETLSRSTFLEFRGVGHGVSNSSACATGITTAFLSDPTAPVDAGCVAAITGPAFPA